MAGSRAAGAHHLTEVSMVHTIVTVFPGASRRRISLRRSSSGGAADLLIFIVFGSVKNGLRRPRWLYTSVQNLFRAPLKR